MEIRGVGLSLLPSQIIVGDAVTDLGVTQVRLDVLMPLKSKANE